MDNTYMTMYVNEIRAIEITIRDQYDDTFAPDSATVRVEDIDGVDVVDEANARISTNTVSTIINEDVTSVVGIYHVIWKIVKSSNVYYHKSIINVKEL